MFTREDLEKKVLDFVKSTLRGSMDTDYSAGMKRFFSSLFKWLVKKKIFEKVENGHKLSKDARSAILADIEVIDYVQVCGPLSKLKEDTDESNLIALLLESRMVQTMRPRSFVPSKMELDVMKLDPPEEWYLQRVPERSG